MATYDIVGTIIRRDVFEPNGVFDTRLVRLRVRTEPAQTIRVVQGRTPGAIRLLESSELAVGSAWRFRRLHLLPTGNLTFKTGSRACK